MATDRRLPVKELICVESIGENLYRACNLVQPIAFRACYGGQVASQALMAATKSVSDLGSDFLLHSFHCYFVRPAQDSLELVYKVERIKAGSSFCLVAVKAIQKGRDTFHCLASFQKNEDLGVELDYNRHPMPVVPHPDDDHDEEREIQLVSPTVRSPVYDVVIGPFGVESFHCVQQHSRKNTRHVCWVRAKDTFSEDYHQNYHRISLVYLTDYSPFASFRKSLPDFKTSLSSSLDHSVWFHAPLKAGQWYLFVSECERFHGGRSLTHRRVYSEDGTLVASVNQETILRPKL